MEASWDFPLYLASPGKLARWQRDSRVLVLGTQTSHNTLHRCFHLQFRGADRKTRDDSLRSPSELRQNIGCKKGPASTSNADAKAGLTNVVFVTKGNAKTLKSELERLAFLDKRFRMTPVLDSNQDGKEIAVPITDECLNLLSNKSAWKENSSWTSLLKGNGQQEMPFSTSQFASKPRKRVQ